jgi:hypothetical protein
MGSIDAPQSAARSPGESSRCRLHKQCGQWLRCAVPGASHVTSSLHRRHRNELDRRGIFPAVCMSFQRSDLSGGRSRTGTTSRPKALTVRRKRRKIQLGTRRDHAPGHGHPSPRRAEWTAPLRPTTVQQAGRPDGNWFSCDLVSPVVARCTAAGSPHGNQKSAGIRSTCPGWMRFGSPMMSRFASRIGPNPVPMYSGSDAAIPDKVSPDWTTCSR